MAYLKPLCEGIAYPLCVAGSGGVTVGQCVTLSGADVVVAGATSGRILGVAKNTAAVGEPVAVNMCGGVYETSEFAGSPSANGLLSCDPSTKKLHPVGEGETAVAVAISVTSTRLVFKLLA